MENLSHKRKILIVLVAALMVGGGIVFAVSLSTPQNGNNVTVPPQPIKSHGITPFVCPYVVLSSNINPIYVCTNITLTATTVDYPSYPVNYEFYEVLPGGSTPLIQSGTSNEVHFCVNKTNFNSTMQFRVIATSSNPSSTSSINLTYVHVYLPPDITITSSRGSIDIPANGSGVSVEFFSSSSTPGISPFTYSWSVGGTTVASATGTDMNYTFGVPANTGCEIYVGVEWSDTTGPLVHHFKALYVESVNSHLSESISSNKNPSDIGQTVTFQAIPSGSTGSYTSYSYKLYDSDSNLSSVLYSGTTSSFSAILDSEGTFLVTYEVESSNGYYQNATLSQQVNSDPSLAISANKTTTDVGNPISLSVSPSGGTSPYSYTWFCSPNGTSTYTQFATGNNPTLKFSKEGSYYVIARLTDSAGFSVNSTTLVITVNPAFTAYITTSSGNKAILSEYVTITLNCVGGSGAPGHLNVPYFYIINPGGSCSVGESGTNQFNVYTGEIGIWTIKAEMSDAAGSVVRPRFSLSVYTNNIGVTFHTKKYEPVGVLVNLNASIFPTFSRPPISQFSYIWTINGVNYSGNNYLYDFATPGTYNITLTAGAVASCIGYPGHTISEQNTTYATVIASSPGNSSNIIINTKQAAISGGESFSWYASFKNSSEYSYYLLIQGDGTGPSQVKTLSNGTLFIEENVYYSNYAPGTYSITLIVYNNRSQSNQSTMGFSVSLSQSNQVTLNTVIEWFGGLTNFIVVIGTIIGIGGTVWAIHANENPNVIIESGTGNKTKQVLLKGKKIRGKK